MKLFVINNTPSPASKIRSVVEYTNKAGIRCKSDTRDIGNRATGEHWLPKGCSNVTMSLWIDDKLEQEPLNITSLNEQGETNHKGACYAIYGEGVTDKVQIYPGFPCYSSIED